MEVITVAHKYPRKQSEYSVWVVEGAGDRTSVEALDRILDEKKGIKRIFCAHPITDRERAEVIAQVWRNAIHGQDTVNLILRAHAEGL